MYSPSFTRYGFPVKICTIPDRLIFSYFQTRNMAQVMASSAMVTFSWFRISSGGHLGVVARFNFRSCCFFKRIDQVVFFKQSGIFKILLCIKSFYRLKHFVGECIRIFEVDFGGLFSFLNF